MYSEVKLSQITVHSSYSEIAQFLQDELSPKVQANCCVAYRNEGGGTPGTLLMKGPRGPSWWWDPGDPLGDGTPGTLLMKGPQRPSWWRDPGDPLDDGTPGTLLMMGPWDPLDEGTPEPSWWRDPGNPLDEGNLGSRDPFDEGTPPKVLYIYTLYS